MRIGLLLGCAFLIAIGRCGVLGEEPSLQGPVLTLIEENDVVVREDRHYTQGVRLSYMHADGFFPFGTSNLYSALPQLGFQSDVGKVGYAVGQNVYTPAETRSAELTSRDRPYAGWLYAGLILQRRGSGLWEKPTQEDFELDLGVIGPWALGKQAQTWIHEFRDFNSPRGWSHQLKNEPALRLKYQRSMRLRAFSFQAVQGEFLPHTGASLGNVETSFRVGGMIRTGFHLPDDYGLWTIDSLATAGAGRTRDEESPRWTFYAFSSTEGRFVVHNAFLDGNLFRRSHSVDKELLVGDLRAGVVVAYRAVELGYTHIWRTPEFRHQTQEDSFGSLSLRLRF